MVHLMFSSIGACDTFLVLAKRSQFPSRQTGTVLLLELVINLMETVKEIIINVYLQPDRREQEHLVGGDGKGK